MTKKNEHDQLAASLASRRQPKKRPAQPASDKITRITLDLDADLYITLKRWCLEHGGVKNAIVLRALIARLDSDLALSETIADEIDRRA